MFMYRSHQPDTDAPEVDGMCLSFNRRGQLYLGPCDGTATLRLRLSQQRLESMDGRCVTNDLGLEEPVLRPCVPDLVEYSQMWGVSTTTPRKPLQSSAIAGVANECRSRL